MQCPFSGLTVCHPELPRTKIHRALRVECRGIEIVRIPPGDLAHRVLVVDRELAQIGFRIGRVALADGFDQRALFRRSALRGGGLRFAYRHNRQLHALRIARVIDIRTHRDCDPPVGHRAVGIQLRGFGERADCLFVIEGIDKSEPLIEVLLRFRILRRHLMVRVAKPCHQLRRAHKRQRESGEKRF